MKPPPPISQPADDVNRSARASGGDLTGAADVCIAEVQQVRKCYHGHPAALADVSLAIQSGVTGLLGPNGSGKSTLIKSLLGLVRTQSGHGHVLGHPWPRRVRTIRDNVGYLPEDDCYIAGLTGIESVAFMAELSGLPPTEGLRRSHEILDFCDLAEERYREVESYSTGMRQKLKFAQALVHDPPLLILDEPTTGLDPDQREAMLNRIRVLASDHGKSVVLSTHILPDVRTVCDHVIMLVGGRVRVIDRLENLSRPATPTVHISLTGDAAAFTRQLSEAGMTVESHGDPHSQGENHDDRASSPHGNRRITVSGVDLDDLSQVWTIAAATHAQVRSLVTATNSLEKMFFEAASDTSATPRSSHHDRRQDMPASL